ncbi:MAG TPA: hypothetical protein VK852_06820, partial [Desulfobacterales bacterium]|nr:hypothetical protein [Desulfobacterales bacterium]
MRRLPMIISLAVMLLVPAWTVFPEIARAQDGLRPERVPWESLRYRAKNLMVELTADMQLQPLPTDQAQAALLESAQGAPVAASGPQTLHLGLQMMIDFAFRKPVNITNALWFNPDDAAALGRYRLRRGEGDFEKIYRFTETGVFRSNREPQTKVEAQGDPETWPDFPDNFYPHDRAALGCSGVTDRLALVYIVSASEGLQRGQPLSLCVFGKRQLHRVLLQPQGLHSLKVDYVEKKPQAQTRRNGELKVLKIALTAEPMASQLDEPENFSFLGLHKNIALFIDPATKLPLQVVGDISAVGSATLKLLEVRLKT